MYPQDKTCVRVLMISNTRMSIDARHAYGMIYVFHRSFIDLDIRVSDVFHRFVFDRSLLSFIDLPCIDVIDLDICVSDVFHRSFFHRSFLSLIDLDIHVSDVFDTSVSDVFDTSRHDLDVYSKEQPCVLNAHIMSRCIQMRRHAYACVI